MIKQRADLSGARWYLARLASMEPVEIVARARSAAMLPIDWAHWKTRPAIPEARWTPLRPDSYPVKLHSQAPANDRFHIFDLEFPVGFEFDWHRDYKYGRPIECRFAGALNIRDTAVVSDIKYVWEPSRHQFLSSLAFAENAEVYANTIIETIDSWLKVNPYLWGVHWTSSLELGMRILSWALLYPRIANGLDTQTDFRERWLASIYLHLRRIAGRLSLYSSANNHLLGELAGLFVGSICFDFWKECKTWRSLAQNLLEREICAQVGEDGVNREQALSYHLFTLELLLLCFIVGRKTDNPFSSTYAQRLQAMAGFIETLATPAGDLPWYGDSDDARGFLLSEEETALEVVMQLAGLVFDRPAWFCFRKTPTSAARALVPDLLMKFEATDGNAKRTRELFPDAGLACVSTQDGKIRVLMDFGPLGFKSTAAHGHADALSLWLAIDEAYFLIDAGTYAYHSHPDWRNFFRGTAAHNTARVDGHDQSEIAGRFLWGAKANSRLLKFDNGTETVTIEAEHDGYMRLPEAVMHRRRVRFSRLSGEITLSDRFECRGRHKVELFFHMHEEACIESVHDSEAQIRWRGKRVTFSSPNPNACWHVVCGSEHPKLGWRSRKFNQKQPIPVLRMQAEIDGPTTMQTLIAISEAV